MIKYQMQKLRRRWMIKVWRFLLRQFSIIPSFSASWRIRRAGNFPHFALRATRGRQFSFNYHLSIFNAPLRNFLRPLPTTHYPLPTKHAFTLIEILISAALFTGIVVLSVGSFTDSIAFNSGANEERAVRQSTRTFIDFLTLQIRQNSATPLYVASTDYVKANGGPASDNFVGTGFLLIDGFDANKMKLPDLATGGEAKAIIIPISPGNDGNTWMYIGSPNPADPANPDENRLGIWKANPIAGSESKIGLQIRDMVWKEAGDLLPSNVILNTLAFRGISPQGPVYDPNDGTITKYSVPAQPYVTIQMQTAPKSNRRNVASFETSITSRDYSFAFPSCTNTNNIPAPCK